MNNLSVEENEVKETEVFLCKIKEAKMDFMAALFNYSQDYLDDKYGEGNAKGFVRNAADGSYELFALVKEEGFEYEP